MTSDGGRRQGEEGWTRVAVAIILLAAVAALVAWNRQPPEQAAPVVVQEKPAPRKVQPPVTPDPRDTARERPDRERTAR